MFNNYFLNVTSYGNYARGHTALLVENSYFENVHDPVVASMYFTAVAAAHSNNIN